MTEDLFPTRLNQLRTKKGMSLEELGKIVGTSKAALSRYESGERSPKIHIVGKLADFFEVDVAWLAGLSDETEATIDLNVIMDNLNDSDKEMVFTLLNKLAHQKENDPLVTYMNLPENYQIIINDVIKEVNFNYIHEHNITENKYYNSDETIFRELFNSLNDDGKELAIDNLNSLQKMFAKETQDSNQDVG